ncbi:hypothetical protein [Burkholderia gladioli]|uniref:hypothetical protein n=1 Tax=Burkholderia gladioli TaxID=28095 RepID=UPI0016414AD7|nr:hypothetical protein [Burkholderia gladioli]
MSPVATSTASATTIASAQSSMLIRSRAGKGSPRPVATWIAEIAIEDGSSRPSTEVKSKPSRSSVGVPNTSTPMPKIDCTTASSATMPASR